MSYNNVGLSTARGSGTNGYIVRNTSALQTRQGPPGFTGQHQRYEDYLNEIAKPPVHRAPDAGILEHERKRQIEIKCLELRDEMEDRGVDDDEIDDAVTALRAKLQSANIVIPGRRATDSHSVAAAKQAEMSRLGRALDIRADHVEGKAFQRETDEERAQRLAEKEEREQARVDAALKREKEEAKRRKEFEQKERLRRREEYRRKKDEDRRRRRAERDRSRSRDRRDRDDSRGRDESRSRSPVRRRRDESHDRSRSRSPAPRRGRDESRSPAPARTSASTAKQEDCARSPSVSRSRSPVRRRRSPSDSRSPSPPPRRRPNDSDSDRSDRD